MLKYARLLKNELSIYFCILSVFKTKIASPEVFFPLKRGLRGGHVDISKNLGFQPKLPLAEFCNFEEKSVYKCLK
jgi:hypothetical protein